MARILIQAENDGDLIKGDIIAAYIGNTHQWANGERYPKYRLLCIDDMPDNLVPEILKRYPETEQIQTSERAPEYTDPKMLPLYRFVIDEELESTYFCDKYCEAWKAENTCPVKNNFSSTRAFFINLRDGGHL